MNLSSDSEDDEREFDYIVQSESQKQESEDIFDFENEFIIDHEHFDDIIQKQIKQINKLTLSLVNIKNNSMDNIIKICNSKIIICDTYNEKAQYIKEHESKSIKTRKMVRGCHKKV